MPDTPEYIYRDDLSQPDHLREPEPEGSLLDLGADIAKFGVAIMALKGVTGRVSRSVYKKVAKNNQTLAKKIAETSGSKKTVQELEKSITTGGLFRGVKHTLARHPEVFNVKSDAGQGWLGALSSAAKTSIEVGKHAKGAYTSLKSSRHFALRAAAKTGKAMAKAFPASLEFYAIGRPLGMLGHDNDLPSWYNVPGHIGEVTKLTAEFALFEGALAGGKTAFKGIAKNISNYTSKHFNAKNNPSLHQFLDKNFAKTVKQGSARSGKFYKTMIAGLAKLEFGRALGEGLSKEVGIAIKDSFGRKAETAAKHSPIRQLSSMSFWKDTLAKAKSYANVQWRSRVRTLYHNNSNSAKDVLDVMTASVARYYKKDPSEFKKMVMGEQKALKSLDNFKNDTNLFGGGSFFAGLIEKIETYNAKAEGSIGGRVLKRQMARGKDLLSKSDKEFSTKLFKFINDNMAKKEAAPIISKLENTFNKMYAGKSIFKKGVSGVVDYSMYNPRNMLTSAIQFADPFFTLPVPRFTKTGTGKLPILKLFQLHKIMGKKGMSQYAFSTEEEQYFQRLVGGKATMEPLNAKINPDTPGRHGLAGVFLDGELWTTEGGTQSLKKVFGVEHKLVINTPYNREAQIRKAMADPEIQEAVGVKKAAEREYWKDKTAHKGIVKKLYKFADQRGWKTPSVLKVMINSIQDKLQIGPRTKVFRDTISDMMSPRKGDVYSSNLGTALVNFIPMAEDASRELYPTLSNPRILRKIADLSGNSLASKNGAEKLRTIARHIEKGTDDKTFLEMFSKNYSAMDDQEIKYIFNSFRSGTLNLSEASKYGRTTMTRRDELTRSLIMDAFGTSSGMNEAASNLKFNLAKDVLGSDLVHNFSRNETAGLRTISSMIDLYQNNFIGRNLNPGFGNYTLAKNNARTIIKEHYKGREQELLKNIQRTPLGEDVSIFSGKDWKEGAFDKVLNGLKSSYNKSGTTHISPYLLVEKGNVGTSLLRTMNFYADRVMDMGNFLGMKYGYEQRIDGIVSLPDSSVLGKYSGKDFNMGGPLKSMMGRIAQGVGVMAALQAADVFTDVNPLFAGSLHYDENILVRHRASNTLEFVQIGKFVEDYTPTDYDAWTNDNGNIKFSKITAGIKHKREVDVARVELSNGPDIFVTLNHGLFTGSEDHLNVVIPELDTEIVRCSSVPHVNENTQLDISEYLDQLDKEKYVIDIIDNRLFGSNIKLLKKSHYKDLTKEETEFLKKYTYVQKCKRRCDLVNAQYIPNSYKKYCYLSYKRSSSNPRIPLVIKLGRDFGYFVGIYLAEGSITEVCGSSVYSLDISNKEQIHPRKGNIRSRIIQSIESVFYKPNIRNSTIVKLHGRLYYDFIDKILRIKKYSQNKNIPTIAFNSNHDFILGLLNGYIDGDGCCKIPSYNGKIQEISTSSTSRELSSGLFILCKMLGLEVKICSRDIQDSRKRKINDRYITQHYRNYCLSIKGINYNGFSIPFSKHRTWKKSISNISRVKRIVLLEKQPEYVYDVSVNDTEKFVGGFGLIYAHNTIFDEGIFVGAAEVGIKSSLAFHKVKDLTGITEIAKDAEGLMPSSTTTIPGGIIGGIMGGPMGIPLGMVANRFLAQALPSADKTYDEMKDIYSGRELVPVRPGRWWLFSKENFNEGDVSYYRPHWFPKLKSQYKYTDTLYGSKTEAFFHKPWSGLGFNPFWLLPGVDKYHYEKCVEENTLIKSKLGYKKIKDFVNGDHVYSSDGLEDIVVEKWNTTAEKSIEIKSSFLNIPSITTKEHRYYAFQSKECYNPKIRCYPWRKWKRCEQCKVMFNKNDWIRADNLKCGDFLIYPIPILNTICIPKINIDITKYSKDSLKRFTPTNLNYELFRLFGYYCAEGHVDRGSVMFTFNSNEVIYHNDVISLLNKFFPNLYVKKDIPKDTNVAVIRVSNIVLRDFFFEFGKKENKHLPFNIFNRLDKKCAIEFVRGVFRGDGSFCNGRATINISNTSLLLLKQCQDLLLNRKIISMISLLQHKQVKYSNGFKRTIYTKDLFVLLIHGQEAMKFRDIIDDDGQKFVCKDNRSNFIVGRYLYTKIVSTKSISKEMNFVDLKIKDSHNFCGMGCVYHNTHYYTRPAPLTEPAFSDVPFFGPILGATIGRLPILGKPIKKMHQQEIDDYYTTRSISNEFGEESTPSMHVPTWTENMLYMKEARPPDSTAARSLRGKNFPSMNPYGVHTLLGEQIYNMTEMAGLHGFLTETVMGGSPYDTTPRFSTTGEMFSTRRAFWDLHLGDLGGFSEFVRRFIPREKKIWKKINPLKNRLPGWLPGPDSDYHIDFQTGDAYTKIPEGEIRLPGYSYSTLYDVKHTMPGRSSSLGKKVKDTVQWMTGLRQEFGEAMEEILEEDTDLHRIIQNNMEMANVAIKSEAMVYDAKNDIMGYVDVLMHDPSARSGMRPLEIKTVSGNKFSNLKSPIPTHVSQLNFYIRQLQSDVGTLLYVNRDDPTQIRTFDMRYSENRWRKDLMKLQEAREIASGIIANGEGFEDGSSYSRLDRFRILSDVAPSSKEYKTAEKIVNIRLKLGMYSPKEIEQIEKIRTHRKHALRKYDFHPIRFKGKVFHPDTNYELMSDNENIKAAAEYNIVERQIGSIWERFLHLNTPFHCLSPDTLVRTNLGYIKISDIKIGCLVYGNSDVPNIVEDICIRNKEENDKIYSVKLSSSNIKTTITGDHYVLSYKMTNKGRRRKPRKNNKSQKATCIPGSYYKCNTCNNIMIPTYNKIEDLNKYDYVCLKINKRLISSENQYIDLSLLLNDSFYLENDILYVKEKNRFGEYINKRKSLPRFIKKTRELYRLIGYYCSEGFTNIEKGILNFTFHKNEIKYINDVINLLTNIFNIKYNLTFINNTAQIRIYNKHIAILFSKLCGSYSHEKYINPILYSNKANIFSLLQGILRGNGTKAGYTKYDSFSSTSLELASFVSEVLNVFNISSILAKLQQTQDSKYGNCRKHDLYTVRIGKTLSLSNNIDNDNFITIDLNKIKSYKKLDHRFINGEYVFYKIDELKNVTDSYNYKLYDIQVKDIASYNLLNFTVHNSKLWNFRTPIEHYKRTRLYGTECLHPSTKILMANLTYKKIKDISVGDYVIDYKGNKQRVLSVDPKNKNNLIQFSIFGNHKPLICTHDHNMLIEKDGKIVDITASCIQPGDYVPYPRYKLNNDIFVHDMSIYCHNIESPRYTINRFIKNNRDFGLIIGWYLAEGYIKYDKWHNIIGIDFAMSVDEIDKINELSSTIKSVFNVECEIQYKNNSKNITVMCYNRYVGKLIYNLCGEHSDNKKLPINLNREMLSGILYGIIHGNGYINKKAHRITIASINEDIINAILFVGTSMDLFGSIQEYEAIEHHVIKGVSCSTKTSYRLRYSGKSYERLLYIINENSDYICEMDEKNYIFKDLYVLLKVKSINPCTYSGSVYDITVENTATFSTNICSVHNSAFWNKPFQDIINPMYRQAFASDTPLEGATTMGWAGFVGLGGSVGGLMGGAAGAMGGALYGAVRGMIGEDQWIPEAIQRKREIEKTFDELKYTKALGLYQQTGDDKYLTEAENTMYSIRRNNYDVGMGTILRSLSNFERPYYTAFVKEGDSKIREEILSSVPKDVAQLLKKEWNRRDGNVSNLVNEGVVRDEYMDSISNIEWEGFSPGTELEDIKIKTIDNEALDAHDFGLGWYNQRARIANSPHALEPIEIGNNELLITNPDFDVDNLRNTITKSLSSIAYHPLVFIGFTPSDDDHAEIQLNLTRDRREEIYEILKEK